MSEEMHISHPIPPVWNKNSRVLILGSFPSVKSRENCFFYGHRQNRFWKVLAACDITGSADSSIRNVKPNDILPIIMKSEITAVFVNGNTAAKLYEKYLFPKTKIKATVLPSTSPANARFTLEMLAEKWSVIKL